MILEALRLPFPRGAFVLPVSPGSLGIVPVLEVYLSSTGALHRTGRMAMLRGQRGQISQALQLFYYFWSRARPEIDHLSGLFRALPWSYSLSIAPSGPGLTFR